MSDYSDYEPASIATTRITLADGRVFVFAAVEGEKREVSFTAIPGLPTMDSNDFELLASLEHIDSNGRIVERMNARTTTKVRS